MNDRDERRRRRYRDLRKREQRNRILHRRKSWRDIFYEHQLIGVM